MEGDIHPKKLKKVLQFNGMPITAKFIYGKIKEQLVNELIS